MSVRVVRLADVVQPSITPQKSTLLDHAKVVDVSGMFGLREWDAGLWPSYNTGVHAIFTDICDPDEKRFDTAPWAAGYTFALQMGWTCATVGLDKAHMESEAQRVFKTLESKGIEQALLNSGLPLVDLTPTQKTTAQALALIEGSAGATYAGVPTILVSRFAASLLNDRIVWEGDKAYTRLGSKVAIAAGFDQTTPSGRAVMLGMGEIYVERSEEINVSLNTVPGDGSVGEGSGSGEAGIGDNMVIALVERMYHVAIDPIRQDGTPGVEASGTEWGL